MKNPSEIEREIEQTRDRMSQDIDAIGEKFTPSHIKERAREKLHDAREAAMEKVQEVAGDVGRKTKDAGNSLMDAVKRNPVPAAMIGAGIAWMIADGRKSSSRGRRYDRSRFQSLDYSYGRGGQWEGSESSMKERAGQAMDTMKEKAQDLTDQAGEKFDQFKEQAGEKAREYQEEMRGFYEENPLIAAAAIAVLGAAIGALIPRTAPEERYLGPMSEKLIEKVKDTASEATERAKGAAQEAVESFTDAFSSSTGSQQEQQRGSTGAGKQR